MKIKTMSENYLENRELNENSQPFQQNLSNQNSSQNPKLQTPQSSQTIIVNPEQRKTNGVGTAGFIMSLIAIFVGWIPILGWLVWLLGLIFSFVGVFKNPKGMAIAGLVISLIGIILLIFVFGAILATAGLSN